MKRFVVMAKDECGDDFRAYSETITIPECNWFDTEDYFEMAEHILSKIIGDIKERYPECYNIHIEREYSSMSPSEWHELGYGDWTDWS